MQLKTNAPLFSRTGMKHTLLTAAAYFFFLALTHLTLLQLPWMQFRFANFVPVLCGIMFGLPGAVGSMLGNLLADRITNTEFSLSFWGSVMNFFSAYLPYRLWYGMNGKRALHFVEDSTSFARYLLINALTSFFVAASLESLFEVYFPIREGDDLTFFTIFCNDYDFPMLLGLPLMIFLCRHAKTIYYPPSRQEKVYGGLQIPALVLLVIIDIGFILLAQSHTSTQTIALIVFALNVLLLVYICTMPSQCEPLPKDTITTSLAGATTGLLLLFITSLIFLTMLTSLLLIDNLTNYFIVLPNMVRFYLLLTVAVNAAFLVFYYLLRWLERTISNPLTALSNRALNYMETGADEIQQQQETAIKNEIQELNLQFSKMSQDIKKYVTDLTIAAEEKHSTLAQLNVAAQIQQGTLPNLSEVNNLLQAKQTGCTVKADMTPAKLVGGDMFDCYLLNDDTLLICVGDVSGKGISASLFAVITQALLSNFANIESATVTNLSDIVKKVNNYLSENNPEILFVTLWVGMLELSTGKLTYVNAGHNPPLMAKKDGATQVQLLEKLSGPVLGLMPEISYTSHETVLPPGHKLLLFTDGLNEAENEAQEFYGDERLRQIFLKAQSPEEILADIKRFTADAPPSDDKTYLWIERT